MFNIHQSICNRDGEVDERRSSKYIDGITQAFAASPEGQPLLEHDGDLGWAEIFLDYLFGYLGVALPEMSLADLNEVLFDLIPRKVSTGPESAAEIIKELRAFWHFLDRQYKLPNAPKILENLTDEAVTDLRNELADPRNWGMAKTIFMQGQAAGFDMATEEGLQAFLDIYNAGQLGGLGPGLPLPPPPLFDEGEEYDEDLDLGPGPAPLTPEQRRQQRDKKRKARKAQRQARKKRRK